MKIIFLVCVLSGSWLFPMSAEKPADPLALPAMMAAVPASEPIPHLDHDGAIYDARKKQWRAALAPERPRVSSSPERRRVKSIPSAPSSPRSGYLWRDGSVRPQIPPPGSEWLPGQDAPLAYHMDYGGRTTHSAMIGPALRIVRPPVSRGSIRTPSLSCDT